MLLKRKIYDALLSWKKEYHGTKAILIGGGKIGRQIQYHIAATFSREV